MRVDMRAVDSNGRKYLVSLLLAFLAMPLAIDHTAYAQSVTATSGDWRIRLGLDSTDRNDSGLNRWEHDPPDLPPQDNLFQEWFWFRTDTGTFANKEYPLDSLTQNALSNINPATGLSEANSIFFDFGGGAQPIRVQGQMQLSGSAGGATPYTSAILETITITNTSTGSLNMNWWAYTDLDLDFFVSDDFGQIFDGNRARQGSSFGSDVTVRIVSGGNPTSWDIARYSEILTKLSDNLITGNFDNSNSFGPGDVTHAFHWNFTLGTGVSDRSKTIILEKSGNFVQFVQPTRTTPSGWEFDVLLPPSTGTPRWWDPAVAVGYEYRITAGNNAFAELYLLDGFEDGQYELEILDANHDQFGQRITVNGGGVATVAYDFQAHDAQSDGVTAFRLYGIEPESDISPTDTLGFPTGLLFVNSNSITFSQNPISVIPSNGDFNRNDLVDAADYVIWRRSLGQNVSIGSGADGNNNGRIDTGDLAVWREHFGQSVSHTGSGQGAAVPEPSTTLMLLTCACSLLMPQAVCRRRGFV
jgi:hypothetical protein